ncbi:MAG: rRNA pseudouridine synthase [Nitrospirae bacterium]|nr:rRNA pseudouridine synthase [Nitrospirota bacterium]
MEERIQKIISSLGITSRRKAEEMIEEGRVTLNGKTVKLGDKADLSHDHIKLDGKLLHAGSASEKVYAKFYKPRQVMTTLEDPEGRRTILKFIEGIGSRVYPVGRLDYDSEGLLLLTNDGELTQKVLHPSKKIPKRYHVKVKGEFSDAVMEKLRKGVMLEDGMTAPSEVRRLKETDTESNTWIEMTLFEGRKRQIRRMLQQLKHPVAKLKRVAINGIKLGSLKPGQWALLTPKELKSLFDETGKPGIQAQKPAPVERTDKPAEKKAPFFEKARRHADRKTSSFEREDKAAEKKPYSFDKTSKSKERQFSKDRPFSFDRTGTAQPPETKHKTETKRKPKMTFVKLDSIDTGKRRVRRKTRDV